MSYSFRIARAEDMPGVYQLLQKVFRPTYGKILTGAQMDWMLTHIFSEEELCRQQRNTSFRFILLGLPGELLGFSVLEQDYNGRAFCCKLHKLYLSVEAQGKGLGRLLIEKSAEHAREMSQEELVLNVNRYNNARYFYEKMGFEVLYQEDIPLANGYFMNDYVMGKKL
ncbi:MAG TPA: GNAT family N-acetyltransferase [Edaphocola sp.]|nr:GNAT family N-acetyltransferase [Edaphocola sp.]